MVSKDPGVAETVATLETQRMIEKRAYEACADILAGVEDHPSTAQIMLMLMKAIHRGVDIGLDAATYVAMQGLEFKLQGIKDEQPRE